ncbi:MAG: hypothetical protein QXI58_01265 [Candidatus Micrarchaeia archaeon]
MSKIDRVIKKVKQAIVQDILERYNHPSYWDYDLIQEQACDAIKEVYGYDPEDEKCQELVQKVIDKLEEEEL